MGAANDQASGTAAIQQGAADGTGRGERHRRITGDPLFEDYLSKALSKTDNTALEATIMRVGSHSGRQLLAWQASGGGMSYERVARKLELLRVPALARSVAESLSSLDADWALRLARVMALQNHEPNDRLNALSLFEHAVSLAGPQIVTRRDARIFCDIAIGLGRLETARDWVRKFQMNKSDRDMVNADLTNPFVGHGTELQPWLDLFNKPFQAAGLEPVSIAEDATGQLLPFDRLACSCDAILDGPLVTIIVSCWCPDDKLLTSVGSLLAQTWRSVEVIVVDDASPQAFHAVLDQVEALDERVTVIRQAQNQGTYVARNAALRVARGEFVTFQDSDDWSHPRRIERQVAYLLANPSIVGATAHMIRATEHLVLGLPGSAAIQDALAFLMFRRQLVMDRIGYYDSVRKSADREYIERISVVFGQKISESSRQPIGICRLLGNSLSRAEFKPGWRHAARNIYKDAFDYWHAQIAKGERSPYRSDMVSEAQFPAPRKFWVDQGRAENDGKYDFVFIGDWRQYGGPQKSMIEEIMALKAVGCRIAICHQEAFRFMTKHRYPNCEPIRKLIHEGVVDEVAMSDKLTVGVLVLRYPPILQFVRHEPSAWKVRRALIVANQAPHELDGTDVRYRVSDCVANFRHLFGVDATWAPQGPQVRDAIQDLVPPALLDPQDMPGILDVNEWRMPSRRAVGARPVIGRYSRDNMMKFPGNVEELLQCYPDAEDIEVRIMGGSNSCPVILGERGVPANWTLVPYNDVPVNVFLAHLDFFVYYDNDQIVEAFGRSILEALASGVVVILPDKFERVFGEAAVYARPDQIAGLVRKIHADPDLQRNLSERGQAYVRKHFSRESYAERMTDLLHA